MRILEVRSKDPWSPATSELILDGDLVQNHAHADMANTVLCGTNTTT